MATITFYGGAGSVTGANFLFDSGKTKLLVDCGTNERENICDPLNHAPFSYDVKNIEALLVTHAHQDHIGRIPKLVREGFRGVIYSTATTKELSEVMFADALHVMQEEAMRSGCGVLYEQGDVDQTLSLWRTHEYHQPFSVGDVTVEMFDAGHILGSAMMKLSHTHDGTTKSVMFTGDLGNSPEPLLNETESPEGVDFLVMESVYGDRVHEQKEDRREVLRNAIETIRANKGTLLIPSFSLERTQILLYEIHTMIEKGEMQPIPVYLDSPLAERITEVFRKHTDLMNPTAQEEFAHGDAFTFSKLAEIHSTGSSRDIHKKPDPKVIIAGAGMSSGGRIRSHEKEYLPDPKAAVLFTGYQAPGSLGRRIQDGARSVSIDSQTVNVHAHIETLSGYSGHKDRDGLLSFAESAGASLKKVFVVMGEPKASGFIAQRIKDFLGVTAVVPMRGDSEEFEW